MKIFGLTIPEYAFKILIPLHLLGALGWFAVGEFKTSDLVLFFIFWFLFGCVGIEIGAHRLFAHRAFECSKNTSHILALLSCFGAQWSPVWWAALHRGVHHKNADGALDVHSPEHGIWHAYAGWYFTYDASKVSFSSVKDLLKDPFQRFLHTNYTRIFWLPIIILALIDFKLSLVCIILPALAAIHQENLINLFCHIPKMGYRRHNTSDRSTNNLILGLFVWGAGFHNNHHGNPKKYDFGELWYEFDLCKLVVPGILFLDRTVLEKIGRVQSND